MTYKGIFKSIYYHYEKHIIKNSISSCSYEPTINTRVETFGAEATLTFYAWVVSGFIGGYFANQTED